MTTHATSPPQRPGTDADGMQHLPARAVWDEVAVRDDIRGWLSLAAALQ
jgi:hypothetical protein